ncbi:MAG TPA: regulatory protein RecX [Bacteroidales bacterium]|nr:regulatory protein RecX [Bacteroidales bacterium]
MNDVNEKLSGLKTILHKAQAYCAYQERCTQEVVQKLRDWKVDENRIPKIIEQLTAENFINDVRFTETFVRSKFKLKKWGKNKVAYELRLKKIPDPIISQSLQAIDDQEYRATLQHLKGQKSKETKEKDLFKKKQKIIRFLVSRGFEMELVMEIFKRNNER